MRKILTIALALTMCAGASMAQLTDTVGLYADAALTNCTLNPTSFGLVTVYVVHDSDAGRVAKFKVNDNLGLTPTGTSVTPGFLSIGTYAAGIEIAYPNCMTGKFVIGTMGYFYQLETMTCARNSQVVPHPGSEHPGFVIVVDCGAPFGSIENAIGGRLWGGSDAELCGGCFESAVSTQESTWGGIKALYR